jgi:beta-glucanase (GH16 family)
MKKYFLKIVFFLLMVCNVKEMKAQLPSGDATFSLVAVDNFTGTTLNTSMWCPNLCFSVEGDTVYYDAANVTVAGGWLKLKCEDIRSTPIYAYNGAIWRWYTFRSGGIGSKFKFKYGYWEMSAKMPVGKGFWPAFWTLGDKQSTKYGEIDIVENIGTESEFGDKMGIRYHWGASGCNCNLDGPPSTPIVSNTANEHKYAVFWEPGKMTWYFDDVEKYSITSANTPVDSSGTLINFDVDFGSTFGNVTATFPDFLQVNYLNISQLIPDCSTVENICSFNAGTYTYKVKKSISIAGSSCTSTINTSSNVGLWATDYVLLDEGTTINNNGSGSFMARTTPCPN